MKYYVLFKEEKLYYSCISRKYFKRAFQVTIEAEDSRLFLVTDEEHKLILLTKLQLLILQKSVLLTLEF